MPDPNDVARGEVAAAQATKYRKRGTGIDANAGADNVSTLVREHGLEVDTDIKVESGFVDPSIVQIIYHAYDGRIRVVPAYMVPKLLSFRFPTGDSFIPAGYWNQQVWDTRPNDNFKPGAVMCLLHADQTEDVKALLKAIGIPSGRCRKHGIMSEFHLNDHMRLKHKQELKMIDAYRTKTDNAETKTMQHAQLDAILKLAEAVSKR